MIKLKWKAYALLLSGVLIAFIGLFYTSNILLGFWHYQITTAKKVAIIERVEQLVSENQNLDHMPLLSFATHSVAIRVVDQPSERAMILGPKQLLNLPDWMHKHEDASHFALGLPSGRWVSIDFSVIRSDAVMLAAFIGIWLAIVALLILLVASTVRMLLKPLARLNAMGRNMSMEAGRSGMIITPIPEAESIVSAVNTLQVRIRTLLSDRTQMLAAISHDLRTPITRLKLRAEGLEDQVLHDKVLSDLADMEHMIDSVLSFVQSDSDEAPVNFDLAVLLQTLVNDMQDAGFSVHYEGGGPDKLPFTGQINKLKRAFSNLLDNAVKYGQGAIVALAANKQHIVITIDDHGPGIPESELQKVFQPFYRVDPTRNKETGGTGLGLVIVQNIIKSHHGDIQLINLPKGGLRVEITLTRDAGA